MLGVGCPTPDSLSSERPRAERGPRVERGPGAERRPGAERGPRAEQGPRAERGPRAEPNADFQTRPSAQKGQAGLLSDRRGAHAHTAGSSTRPGPPPSGSAPAAAAWTSERAPRVGESPPWGL